MESSSRGLSSGGPDEVIILQPLGCACIALCAAGALLSIFKDRLHRKERFVGVRIDEREDVYPALKQFFGQRGIEA